MQDGGAELVLCLQAARQPLWENTPRAVSTHSEQQGGYRDFVLDMNIWPHSKRNKGVEANIKRRR